METQNTEAGFHFLEISAEGALQEGCARVEGLNRDALGRRAAERRLRSRAVSPLIRKDHTHIDRRLLASIHHSRRKRALWHPPAADETRNPPLTQAFGSLAQRLRARRFTLQTPAHTSVAWVMAILAIVCALTAMLIIEIAISV